MRFRLGRLGIVLVAAVLGAGARAQAISGDAITQIQAIQNLKAGMTLAQRKMDSRIVYGTLKANNDPRVASIANTIPSLSATDPIRPSVKPTGVAVTPSSAVAVTIVAPVTADLNAAIAGVGGQIIYQSTRFGRTTAAIPLPALSTLAARSDVARIKLPSQAVSNLGSVTSQGVVSHMANTVVASLHIDGAGVTVGVMSHNASDVRIAALIASGDLPPNTRSLPGLSGPVDTDEGAAMMEIVHDMAPGANLVFATNQPTEEAYADNIIALANAGCKVIVDDAFYLAEPVFQDGVIAQAVNMVTAMDVIYFSSAHNDGSLTKGTSSVWEGDFADGGLIDGTLASLGVVGRLHAFSTTQNFDSVALFAAPYVVLQWSDPYGASSNDYDLYVLNATGDTLIGASGDAQDGTSPQDPLEIAYPWFDQNFPSGSRIVVVKYAGEARALHLGVGGAILQIGTTGSTYGHSAAAKAVTVAATYWNSAKTGFKPFTGLANTNEIFSSDGPRRIFFDPAGGAVTPGRFLFANGGIDLQKPDIAAADGIIARTPGFNPFYGTSAASPHAAGIAALIRSARPDYTAAQTRAAIINTALDSMGKGVDRDSGYGIAMAYAAVSYALAH